MVTTKSYLSIPHWVDLTKESGWKQFPDSKREFFIARSHFMVREHQLDERPRYGEILAVHQAPGGVQQERMISIEQQRETLRLEESLASSLLEDEATRQFVAGLAGSIGTSAIGQLSHSIKAQAAETIRTSFSQTFKIQDVVSRRETVKFELRYTIAPEVTERLAAVAVYQRCACDLYLAFVDYLFVEYGKSMLGLRKKRKKRPVPRSRIHPNVIKFNVPLVSIRFWELSPSSSVIVREAEHRNEVADPFDVDVVPLEDAHLYRVDMPRVPTLYQLSNAAFPLRWIDRKGEWTQEELMSIEMEEAEGTAWWWEYGPGRTKS